MERKRTELSDVLKYVDSFAEVYLKVVFRWMEKEKCDKSALDFLLGKSPYYFPPDIIYKKDGKQEKISNFKLPYKREEEHCTDSDAGDINVCVGRHPEYLEAVRKRFDEHLLKIRGEGTLVSEAKREEKRMGLIMQGFYKEMDYNKTTLSIYDDMQEKGNEEEEKICSYLNEGTVLMESPVRIMDVINKDHGAIGNFCLRTDGVWMWPAELSYYVKTYHLKLDEKFVETMRKNSWHVTMPSTVNGSKIEFLEKH